MHYADHTFDSDTNKWGSYKSAKNLLTCDLSKTLEPKEYRSTFEKEHKEFSSHLLPLPFDITSLKPPWHKEGVFLEKVQWSSKECLFLLCAANFWCLTIEGEDAPIFLGLAFHWDFRHQTLPKSFVYSEQKSYVEANILKYFVNLRLVKRYSEGQLEIGNQFLLHR